MSSSEPSPSSWWAMALEVLGLAGLAVTQPLLDVFGNSPEAFIEAGASRRDIVIFALGIALVPALVAAALQLTIGAFASTRVRALVHAAIVGGFAALLVAQVVAKQTTLSGTVVWLAALVTGVSLIALIGRAAWIRIWLRYLSVATPIFVAVFLFSSPVSALLDASSQRGVAAVGKPDRGPVVLLVLDELPLRSLLDADGNIDASRFPGFGKLAANSTWYRNTTSVSSHTMSAVPAIFTGQYPEANDGAPTADRYPENLFRLMERSFRFNVSEHVTSMCAVARCDPDDTANAPELAHRESVLDVADQSDGLAALFPRAWRVYQTLVDGSAEDAGPDAGHDGQFEEDLVQPDTEGAVPQPALFARWLSTIDGDTDRPQFSALHTRIPHHPWFVGGEGVPYLVPGGPDRLLGLDKRVWVNGDGLTITTRQRHLLMVRYTDTLVAALEARLESLGIWDTATVIVTADHGAAFEPGGQFRYWDASNSPEIIGVPLFVHGPDFRGGAVVDTPTQLVDIAPTIAQVSGIEAPWPADGVSVLDLPTRPRTKHPYALGATDDRTFHLRSIDVGDHLERLLALRPVPGDEGGGDLDILRQSPHGTLIGQEVDGLATGPVVAGRVHQRFPRSPSPNDAFAIDDDGRVPAYLFGTVAGLDPGVPIVVTIDGRVAGTTTVFKGESGAHSYAVLLPPTWLAEGSHRIRYYALDETDDDGPRLLPLEST
jgi:hypothetical protein